MEVTGGSPRSGDALTVTVDWVAAVLLGQVATSLAILAVACLGFLMLWGRLPMRRGASVIVGCFILFSASGIASGLLTAMKSGGAGTPADLAAREPVYAPTTPKAEPYDPYSGAAVPDQRGSDLLE
jgi:type IV secretory pathway VirB2 component (pilin)